MACPSPVLSDSDSHRRVMVSDHHYFLLRIGQIDPPIAFVTGSKIRSRPRRALRLRSPRETPLSVAMNVLLLHGTPGPKRIRGTFLRHEPTRRTCFYAAIRARRRCYARAHRGVPSRKRCARAPISRSREARSGAAGACGLGARRRRRMTTRRAGEDDAAGSDTPSPSAGRRTRPVRRSRSSA
jgi:hypothetical protein